MKILKVGVDLCEFELLELCEFEVLSYFYSFSRIDIKLPLEFLL